MSEPNQAGPGPSPDFLKSWQDSFARIIQAAGSFSPESIPPEMLGQIRSGIFQALTKSWDDYMRSPQFLQAMKQSMDAAIAFRKMSSDFLTRAHQEMQGTSRQDVDDLLLAMREMEARLTRRVDDLAGQVAGAKGRTARSGAPTRRTAKAARKAPAKRKSTGPRKAGGKRR